MTGNFIYTQNECIRDELLRLGYTPLKFDDSAHMYVFVNDARSEMNFTYDKSNIVFSDTLSF